MRPIEMTAKKSGTCLECCNAIKKGQRIFWARGRGAWHVDCQNASLQATLCTSCDGSGRRWNNATCSACDGTGQRSVQDAANAHPRTDGGRGLVSQFVPDPVDMAYEDDCARRCGL